MSVPRSIDEVTDAWLSDALGRPSRIADRSRIGEGYGLASEIHRLDLEGGSPELVVKLWGFDGPADETEVHFYRNLGSRLGIRAPRCFHAEHDEERAVLVLEAFPQARQGDVLVREATESLVAIAGTIGLLHGAWWDSDELVEHRWLRDAMATRRSPDWFASRGGRFVQRFGQPRSRLARDMLERAEFVFSVGTDALQSMPITLGHGDLHLDNILFNPDPVVLDWAGCRRGPAGPDITAVAFGMGQPEQVDVLLDAYQTALASTGVEVNPQTFERAMGGAVLWSFVFWTLGVAAWMPTDERGAAIQARHIGDAFRMVEYWSGRDPGLFERVLRNS